MALERSTDLRMLINDEREPADAREVSNPPLARLSRTCDDPDVRRDDADWACCVADDDVDTCLGDDVSLPLLPNRIARNLLFKLRNA